MPICPLDRRGAFGKKSYCVDDEGTVLVGPGATVPLPSSGMGQDLARQARWCSAFVGDTLTFAPPVDHASLKVEPSAIWAWPGQAEVQCGSLAGARVNADQDKACDVILFAPSRDPQQLRDLIARWLVSGVGDTAVRGSPGFFVIPISVSALLLAGYDLAETLTS